MPGDLVVRAKGFRIKENSGKVSYDISYYAGFSLGDFLLLLCVCLFHFSISLT